MGWIDSNCFGIDQPINVQKQADVVMKLENAIRANSLDCEEVASKLNQGGTYP